jgi:uncharacterized membrane protein HdeD (DUF308 family)
MSDSDGEARSVGGQVHHRLTQLLSAAMIVIGVAFLARAAGGASIYTIVLGVLFLVAGCGRLYAQAQRRNRG